ncbi:MAG: chemotaxis protein CheW [Alkalibacterium sp.]|nr:chemotaxis protein CheW [Alkalibacterium sp.]
MQVIVFKLKNHFYGFTTESIEEITRPLEETVIPQGPSWTQGLVNLRGQIMTLVDMEVLLNGSSSNDKLWYNNTVIVNAEENPIALMVGKVLGVIDILEEDIHNDIDEENESVMGYISAYDEMITIIELDSILKEKEEVA